MWCFCSADVIWEIELFNKKESYNKCEPIKSYYYPWLFSTLHRASLDLAEGGKVTAVVVTLMQLTKIHQKCINSNYWQDELSLVYYHKKMSRAFAWHNTFFHCIKAFTFFVLLFRNDRFGQIDRRGCSLARTPPTQMRIPKSNGRRKGGTKYERHHKEEHS